MTSTLAPSPVPHAIMATVLGSVGGALGVALRVGGILGAELGHLARSAFVSGMDLGLAAGAGVALAGCLIALIALPSRDQGPANRQPTTMTPPGRPADGEEDSEFLRNGPW
jgi:hypothetical protein